MFGRQVGDEMQQAVRQCLVVFGQSVGGRLLPEASGLLQQSEAEGDQSLREAEVGDPVHLAMTYVTVRREWTKTGLRGKADW